MSEMKFSRATRGHGVEICGAFSPNRRQVSRDRGNPTWAAAAATLNAKVASVETGASIQVPIFVNEGDLLRIDSRTGEYIERVKE